MIKKMRKRLLTIGLTLVLVISVCGCSSEADPQITDNTENKVDVSDSDSSKANNDAQSLTTTEKPGDTERLDDAGETETTTNVAGVGDTEDTTTPSNSETETTKKPEQTTTKKPEQTTTKKPEQATTKKPEQATIKPGGTSGDTSDLSNVHEKLTWTNAGWANEYNKTASGNYIYVTNKKQTIDPVKGNGFSVSSVAFSLQEWTAMDISGYIKGNPGTIRWKSEDPSIAQIIDNEIVGIYAGTTKISGTCGNTTVQIEVTVTTGYRSSDVRLNSQIVTLYPNESYQLIASERGTKYNSNDTGIATVSADGVVTGVKPGNTTITATYNGKQCVCKVTVAANDGTYMTSTLDTKYTITKERVLLATDRTFIVLDAGVVIEDNLLKNIETTLDKIEEVTGYSFTNTNDKLTTFGLTDRIVIGVSAAGDAYAHTNGVMLAPYDITIEECGAHVLVHELLHTVQHRNTVCCGNAMTEGFAEYIGMKIYTNLPFCRNTFDENYNSWINMKVSFGDITLTADNMEYYLLHSPDIHPTSYFFVSYLAKTYGEDKIYKIQKAITEEFIKRFGSANGGGIRQEFTEEDIFAVIKSMTSVNVAKDFFAYFSGLEEQSEAKRLDLTGYTDVFYEKFEGHMTGSYFDLDGGDVTVNGPFVIDFSRAIDYAEKVFGRKAKGLNVSAIIIYEDHLEKVPVTYYDNAGNIVEMPADFDQNDGYMPAVRVKLDKQTAGVMRLFINTQYMYDTYY
ncbi:MAG: Ig-like domain-containing protein [Lachnospiraceae bacterium]|nr:Ig-like domain-containing protein [Lachnospiraceae bacterium]